MSEEIKLEEPKDAVPTDLEEINDIQNAVALTLKRAIALEKTYRS